MFSGIVSEIGTVSSLEERGDTVRLAIAAAMFEAEVEELVPEGASIAVSGVCLTRVSPEVGIGLFDIASETRRKTTISGLTEGVRVNLERSLRLSDRLDGHLVQGHVDAVAEVRALGDEGNTRRLTFELPASLRAYVAPKGAIAIDGVSLTVGEVEEKEFSVYIVPHTWERTILGAYEIGTSVNLEADCIARYAVHAAKLRE